MKSRGNAIYTQLSPEEVLLCLCFRHVQGDLGTWQGLDMQLGDHGWGMSDLKSQILLVTGVKKKYVRKITDIARNWGKRNQLKRSQILLATGVKTTQHTANSLG